LHMVHFFFSSRRRHTRWSRDWSSDVCSSHLIRSIGHRVGAKPQRELNCLFWRPKPEDALRSNQKFFGVDHRSLPCEAKSRFATSTGSSKSSEARCPNLRSKAVPPYSARKFGVAFNSFLSARC